MFLECCLFNAIHVCVFSSFFCLLVGNMEHKIVKGAQHVFENNNIKQHAIVRDAVIAERSCLKSKFYK